jgi:hypothetical protein
VLDVVDAAVAEAQVDDEVPLAFEEQREEKREEPAHDDVLFGLHASTRNHRAS